MPAHYVLHNKDRVRIVTNEFVGKNGQILLKQVQQKVKLKIIIRNRLK